MFRPVEPLDVELIRIVGVPSFEESTGDWAPEKRTAIRSAKRAVPMPEEFVAVHHELSNEARAPAIELTDPGSVWT